jgi:hypothetical protein
LEGERFDNLSRSVALASRRRLFHGLVGMAAGALSACTGASRPSGLSGQDWEDPTGPPSSCDLEKVSLCTVMAFYRERHDLDQCFGECMRVVEVSEWQRQCRACLQWFYSRERWSRRQCHAQACGEGKFCTRWGKKEPGTVYFEVCCPFGHRPHFILGHEPFCMRQCADPWNRPVCDPPYTLDWEYCECVCDVSLDCPSGTRLDGFTCTCV